MKGTIFIWTICLFAVSVRNPNTKIIHWNAFNAEYDTHCFYKPVKQDHITDAFSRQDVNALEDALRSGIIHNDFFSSSSIETSEKPLNCFITQMYWKLHVHAKSC